MDFGGFGGSNFSFSLGSGGLSVPVSQTPKVMNAGTPATSAPDGVSGWIQTLIGDGLDAYKTYSAVDLANEQIKAGQIPTVIGQNGSLSGTANVAATQSLASSASLSWILVIVAIVAVVLVMKAM